MNNTQRNKDVYWGHIIRNVRRSGDQLLFAMLCNIKGYDIDGDKFVLICSNAVNYEDLKSPEYLEILNNYLQKIDSAMSFAVQLEEDNTMKIRNENIAKLKKLFGKYIKFA